MSSDNEEKPTKKSRTEEEGQNGSAVAEKAPSKESKFHRGKWTNEECQYMLGLMEAFKAGHLPLREGTTLRSFLSSMMKCKPKRISKKFEGISYNGRMVYQKSKHPISLQASMLLRARLSELERRYLEAAREQREGHDSIDALLRQESSNEHQEIHNKEPSAIATAAAFASISSDDRGSPARGLFEANLSSGLGGLGAGSKFQLESTRHSGEMTRLFGDQVRNSMASASLSGIGSSLLDSPPNNTSLVSARLADGSDTYKILSQRYLPRAEFPRHLPQSSHSDFHSPLGELERQQTLASLSSSDAASTIAAMELRERMLATRFPQVPATGNLSLGSRASQGVLPGMRPAGLNRERTSPRFDSIASAKHDLDLNRFVLQAPQDEATYFRQRLLPGVSLQNTSEMKLGASASLRNAGFSAFLGEQSANMGDLSKYMNLQLEGTGNQGIKRSRC